MIAHVLRLAVGEWHKLRRRWIPWILLGIVVFLTQGLVWGATSRITSSTRYPKRA